MIAKPFQELSLSALGLGCMRLPTVAGDDARIDEDRAGEMLRYAMEHGVNYYDTAWGYHGGESERVMGKLLSAYPRESFYLASKFPGYDAENFGHIEEIFEKQLEKCRVDYFDFYLFHSLGESNLDAYLSPEYDLLGYLLKQKERGRIRHLGFSNHATLPGLKRFLDAYGKHMEFGQLQLNWLDWRFQRAQDQVALLKEHNLPVWVMEPVRGGRLAALSEPHTAKLRELRPEETTPGWAFRFLQTLPEVTVTLSGMSNIQQLKENIRTFETAQPLSKAEWDALQIIADEMTGRITLPCTGCRYCTAYCPRELDIPRLLELYNEHFFTEGGFIAPTEVGALPEDKRPAACVGCRSCEAVCPQQIAISEAMSRFAEKL